MPGGILHDLTIQRIGARIVCGAANNPLTRSHHADRLHQKGVLYMPDFVVNAGAVIRGAEFHLHGRATPLAEIEGRVGDVASSVLRLAAERDETPFTIARNEAERRLGETDEPGGDGPDVRAPLGLGTDGRLR